MDSENKKDEYIFEDLAPVTNAENIEVYSKALDTALSKENVTNIAVTGDYGSGKSSFIRSYEKNDEYNQYINISLASFDKKEPIKDLERIEKSILQQIIYREKDSKIPNSRFRRIKYVDEEEYLFAGFLSIIWIITAYFLSNRDKYSFVEDMSFFLISIFILGLTLVSTKFISFLSTSKISKLNLKDGNIEFDKDENISVFNRYLDEIIYFFQVTSYSIVVIEDLDRFENNEIFIRLRELNSLLNNSNNIDRKIVFMYAIKDDVFKDKDRTKFFDFMIPIIPIIDSSNSKNFIISKLKELDLEKEFSKKFLRDISYYIDDMRLLKNIFNELYIYKNTIKFKNMSYEKMFGMIAYKNRYPNDFALLTNNGGDVYGVINKKAKVINSLTKSLEEKISKNEQRREKIIKEKITDIRELRKIYIFGVFELITSNNYNDIKIGYEHYSILQLLEEDNFQKFSNANNISGYYNHPVISFSEIESHIGEKYSDRVSIIEDITSNKVEVIKKDNESLKLKIELIQKFSVQQLISEYQQKENFFESIQELKDKKLITYLISNGYINEQYNHYTSIFHDGEITRNDQEFVFNIIEKNHLGFDYKLSEIKVLVEEEISPEEWKKEQVLNFNLVEYLIEHQDTDKNKKFLNTIYKTLTNKSSLSKNFIDQFLFITKHQEEFLMELISRWKNIWIDLIETFSERKKRRYFKVFYRYLSLKELEDINVGNKVTEFINNYKSLGDAYSLEDLNEKNTNESFLEEYGHAEKTRDVIEKLDIKFIELDSLDFHQNNKLVYIIENGHFVINKNNLDAIIDYLNVRKSGHFTTILNCNVDGLVNYILENINDYISNVFLKVTNNQEEEESIFKLLKNENLTIENKLKIVRNQKFKVLELSQLELDASIYLELFKLNKIDANWDNFLFAFSKTGSLEEEMITFLNIDENSEELSKTKINTNKKFDKKLDTQLTIKLIENNTLSLITYVNLVKSCPYWKFLNIDITHLEQDKVEVLIKNKLLAVTNKNLDRIRENFPKFTIIFLESLKSDYLKKIEDIKLLTDEYHHLLLSDEFDIKEKNKVINSIPLEEFENDALTKETIKLLSIEQKALNKELFDKLFEFSSLDDALKLLRLQITQLDKPNFSDYLEQLDAPYSKLMIPSATPLYVENNEINNLLLTDLKALDYIGVFKEDPKKENILKVNRKRK